jgi:hypothetical protein
MRHDKLDGVKVEGAGVGLHAANVQPRLSRNTPGAQRNDSARR